VLSRCEWGHDDYSLNVANLPLAEPAPAPAVAAVPARNKRGKVSGPDLFGDGTEGSSHGEEA
jgi:adenine-specific DNA-methyltransferase